MSDAFSDLARLAVDTGQPLLDLLHRHAMEGLLRRVAATPAGGHLVLRGSLMTRLWSRPACRPAGDADYVATYPFDPARATGAVRAACEVADLGDGLHFVPEVMSVQITWAESRFPGSRFRVPVAIGGHSLDVQVDVGYDDPLVPPPEWVDYPTLIRGPGIKVLACRPELGLAWKVHGLFEFRHWRSKDLHDISLIVRNTPLDRPTLTEAVRVAFESRGTPLSDALRLFRGEFGTSRGSRLKWGAFRRQRSDPSVPLDHMEVVRSVAVFLRPIFEDLMGGGVPETMRRRRVENEGDPER